MDAKSEGKVTTYVWAIDDEGVRVFHKALVPIARDIPHNDFVACFNILPTQFRVFLADATHMR